MSEAPLPVVQFLREGFDPVSELARLRAELPVSQLQVPGGPTTWLVTRHEDVRAVLGDAGRFSNDFGNLAASGGGDAFDQENPGGLGFRDPPEHTRLRRLLTPEFTVRRLERLKPRIETIVDEHLAGMEKSGEPADLVEAFALPIPSLVVCELLGVPHEEQADFQRRSHDRFDLSADDGQASMAAMNESVSYLEGLVARQRVEPGDGLIGGLLRQHGDNIGDRELAGLADGLLTGGHDTTTSMLALGALKLLRSPDLFELVRTRDDQVHRVVEELLRYLTVVQVAFPRFAREDVVLSGQRIAAGDMVVCSLSGANRDTALGEGTGDVDPDRGANPHVAFGHGMHHCVGAQLARMVLRTAFPALLRRFPELRLAVPFEQVAFRPCSIVYGVESLPVSW